MGAKAFKLIMQNGRYELDTSPVRTIAAGIQHLGAAGHVVWDGKTDGGAAVPDGMYAVALSVVDSCGNTHQLWIPVAVDNTPPAVAITYPKAGDPLGNIVEVKGSAEDPHLLSYTLEAGQGDGSVGWTLIASGAKPEISGVIGKWSTYGLAEGVWTLRLTAVDSVGNAAAATSEINLGARQTLIKNLDVMPKLFSPNYDGKLDATTVNYEITDASNITISVMGPNGTAVSTYTASHSGPGEYSVVFNGKNAANGVVADGEYTVKLTAVLPSNALISQVETVTTIVDTTAPSVAISCPVGNLYTSSQDVTVAGAITDPNMAIYTVNSAVNSGSILIDQGSQSRSDFVFGTLNALAEGDYTIAVHAKDLGENEIDKNIVFTIDRTPPAVKLGTPKAGEYYGAGKNIISINGSIVEKNLAAFSLRYGAGDHPTEWTDLVSGSTLTAYPEQFIWKAGPDDGIADGLYTLSLFARDKAGLLGEVRVKVTIDNTPPQTAITSPEEGSYVKTSIEIKGTAFDQNHDKYTLEISEGQCASAFKWASIKSATTSVQEGTLATWKALPPDGVYCVRLTAIDKVGQTAEAKVHVKVDTHPPAAPALSGNVENTTDAKLAWEGNTEPDLAGFNVYRSGQKINPEPVSGNEFLDQNLAEGVYEYFVKAVDFAGWESAASSTLKIKIDLTGPTARIRSPQDASWISGAIDIKGAVFSADDFKQYRVSIGQGTSPASWNLVRTSPLAISYGVLTQWDTLGLAEGIYSIKLEAEDTSGNVTIHQISVSIDNTAPAKPATPSASADLSDITAAWASNSESDLAGYLLYRNDQLANVAGIVVGDLKPYLIAPVPGTTPYLDKSLPDGTYRYHVIAMDEAGNMSEQSDYSIDVVIDTRAPHAAITDPADNASIGGKIIVKAESPDLDIASIQFQYQSILSSPTRTADWLDLGGPVSSATLMTNMDPVMLNLAYGDYRLRAVATDNGQKTDPAPGFITVAYTDLTPPKAPTGLNALVTGGTVSLTWSANTETDLAGYNVYRTTGNTRTMINTSLVTSLPPSSHEGGVGDASYAYDVTAADTFGNESKPSNTASAKIYTPVITQPYTPASQPSIELSGNNAQANSTVELFVEDVAGYELRGTTTADAAGKFTASITLGHGANRITARATDSAGNVSKDSEAVIAVCEQAPAAPAGLAAEALDHDVHITWNSNTETDILGYNVYRDGVRLNGTDMVYPYDYSASSIDPYYEHEPWMAADYDRSTYWTPTGIVSPVLPGWWEANLGSPELINRLEILWGTDRDGSGNEVLYAGKDYEVQVWSSDANAWITQAKVTGNTVKDNAFDFKPAYRTDKIRIFVTDATDVNSTKQVRLAEVNIQKDNVVQAAPPAYDDLNLPDKQYDYTVTAVDNYGFESPASEMARATVGDVIAPQVRLSLSAAVNSSYITLSWQGDPSDDPDVAGYQIYRNADQEWTRITSSPLSGTLYVDANLMNGTYSYRVTAVDAVGNESTPSNDAAATVYVAPPDKSAILTVSTTPEGGLNAIWTYDGSPAGFNIYRSLTAGGPYGKINSALVNGYSYLDTGVTIGVTYYYVVAAADLAGNRGSFSNEASGAPLDTVAPAKPVIFFPTVAGAPVTLHENKTDIFGSTEPGALVNLFKNGAFAGWTTAQTQDAVRTFPISDYGDSGASLSPDGKTLAYYSTSDALWLKTTATGSAKEIVPGGRLPLWSPDGSRIAYSYWNSAERLWIYDVATGGSAPLTNDTQVHEYSPSSWSADGAKLVFTSYSYRNGLYSVWLKDFTSGSLTKILDNVADHKLSPDGTKLAYFEGANLLIRDIVTGDDVLADDNTDEYSIDWSPDGKELVFVSYQNGDGDVYILDIAGGTRTRVSGTSGNPYYLKWAADGRHVLFYRWDATNEQDTVWLADVRAQSLPRRIMNDLSYVPYIGCSKTGNITSIGTNAAGVFTEHFLDLQGGFAFNNIALSPGENSITATASDDTGNMSEPSDAILITLDDSRLPDLAAISADVYLYPSMPVAGDQMAINAVVWNKGAADAYDVDVLVYIWNARSELALLKTERIPLIAAQSAELVAAVWDSTGTVGSNRIVVVTDPYDAVAERDETNNMAIKDFYVADKEGISLLTDLDASQYTSNAPVNVAVTLYNSGPAKNAVLEVQIEDSSRNVVKIFDAIPVHIVYASQSVQRFVWNTGSTYAGEYQVRTVLKDASGIAGENNAPFSILPDSTVGLTVVTDKVSYGPGEKAAIITTLKNRGSNHVIPSLTVEATVADGAGTILFQDMKSVVDLLPGAGVQLATLWNTGAYGAGLYPVAVKITDTNNSVVAEGTRSINIVYPQNPKAVIAGQVGVDKNSLLAGEPVTVSYGITNVGNVDLADVAISLRTVHVANQTVYDSIFSQASITVGNSYTDAKQFDTTSYAAMDYLVVLQASINGGAEETIAGSYFRVEGAPTVPALSAPADGSDVQTLLPVLEVNNASDPNDDKLTYEFGIYADSGLTTLIASAGGIAQGTGTTAFQAPAELTENSTYYWRSRAYDGKLYSEWMLPVSFRVNVANDLPTAPTIASPPDNTEVPTLTPILTVNNASDPDSMNLTYNFQVALDPDFTQSVAPVIGVPSGQGSTSWLVTPALSENTWYYWRAQADDWLDVGPWSATAKFFVNMTNNPPTIPVILSPTESAVVASLNADIVLKNSTDIDSPVISYYVEVDTVPTFDSASIIRSGVVPEGSGTTTWRAIGLLDNTLYYVRAMAGDGSAGSGWTDPAVKFFLNTANDAPATPVIANPSIGAGVSVDTPTLAVHNATDLDRDSLTYEFEVCSDAACTSRVDRAEGIVETAGTTSWTVTVALTENQTYYWRARAYDGSLNSGWAEAWFVVNTANDAPVAPTIFTPLNGGSVDTATPTLTVLNATDPDSDRLTYSFEVYNGSTLVWSITGVSEGTAGSTSVTIPTALSNNTVYQWQCRAYDGDRYGPWTARANFTVHLPQTGITVEIEVEPETLSKKSKGNWVMVEIELPHGYKASDVDVSSIRLEGAVPAVAWPNEKKKKRHEHGCDEDRGEHDHGELKVKFRRSEVIAVLPAGEHVPVHVTGTVAGTTFEGVDIIRVIK